MSYGHTQYIVPLTDSTISALVTGVVGIPWTPGFVPHIVRAFTISTNFDPGTGLDDLSGMVALLQRVEEGDSTAATTIATINGITAGVPGLVLFKGDLNAKVDPGDVLQLDISIAAAEAVQIHASVLMQASWDEPTSFPNMIATL